MPQSARKRRKYQLPFFTAMFVLFLVFARQGRPQSQSFFPLEDVRPGLKGTGRTVFSGNRIESFEVEILGVLQNLTPKQSIILARLSGGPLAETGVMQGMSGSPVYIDGKLLGAVALGFPFSKVPIAGIQPISQMLTEDASPPRLPNAHRQAPAGQMQPASQKTLAGLSLPTSGFGTLREIFTPLALSGFSDRTSSTFAAHFRQLGLDPQQGVGGGQPKSQALSGTVQPGSMISVQLLTGDMAMSADGTVTYVDGSRVYAFGHRFLDAGTTDLPFARADVVALLPAVNSSFKLSAAREWVGRITSDHSTAIAGEIGRPANLIPLEVDLQAATGKGRDYHMRVVNDPLLTPFITQTAIFSCIDATERTLGSGTLELHTTITFEGNTPPLDLSETYVSDTGVAQPAANDAVSTLNFLLGGRFRELKVKSLRYQLSPVEPRRQLRIAQAWTSRRQVRPGDSVAVSVLLQGENGYETTQSARYTVPAGLPNGPVNMTISDAITLNAAEFAGLSQASFRSGSDLVNAIRNYRSSDSAYVRLWRQEPSFTVNGPSPASEITDPPPSVMLVMADPSSSTSGSTTTSNVRGSTLAELRMPVPRYVVTGAKTIQIEIKD